MRYVVTDGRPKNKNRKELREIKFEQSKSGSSRSDLANNDRVNPRRMVLREVSDNYSNLDTSEVFDDVFIGGSTILPYARSADKYLEV
ncbi:hypothetical protein EVAR_67558_1 [Eumeta japonica]|uniref:Uncharacterized protein n=1 Tax=Eumeta variegata TaxID=151549 RepID=A0A4C1ZLB3_EUMVA|nr:hypothetical protein EVAR_67558_1 [Eumeta japonica]